MPVKTKNILRDRKFLALLLLVIVVLAIGTMFYAHVEHWRLLDALYFSAITLTTVGFGDFAPHTDTGKWFTIFYLLIGIGVLLALITVIAEHTLNNYRKVTEAYLERNEEVTANLLERLLKK